MILLVLNATRVIDKVSHLINVVLSLSCLSCIYCKLSNSPQKIGIEKQTTGWLSDRSTEDRLSKLLIFAGRITI